MKIANIKKVTKNNSLNIYANKVFIFFIYKLRKNTGN